jgi:hypothetical protein
MSALYISKYKALQDEETISTSTRNQNMILWSSNLQHSPYQHNNKPVPYKLHFNSLIPGSAVEAPAWKQADEWRPFSVLSWILMVTCTGI